MRNLFKKLALSVPSVRNVHVDLENRRRRVAELEGHLRVMKKQMAKALNQSNSATLNQSRSSSDINHVRLELDKLTSKHTILKEKYDTLYSDYCILSMSNEALTETNASMLNGDFFHSPKPKPKKSTSKTGTAKKKVTQKTTTTRRKAVAKPRNKSASSKAKQK